MKPSLGQAVEVVWPKHKLNGHKGAVTGLDDLMQLAVVNLGGIGSSVPYRRLKPIPKPDVIQRQFTDREFGA